MNIREEIKQLISQALSELDVTTEKEVVLDYPAEYAMGDYATPVAMQLGKQLGQNPKELAEQIVKILEARLPSMVEKVEVAGPGFINFTLSKEYWSNLVRDSIPKLGDEWGSNTKLEGKKYLVEHSSPNMFKPFHVGHLVNNFVGASVNRVLEKSGANTTVISYPSDVSPGIAKAVWGLMQKGWGSNFTIEQVGEAYAYGSTAYKENEEAKEAINTINLEIYEKESTPAYTVYQKGIELSYEYFKNITTRLGSTFVDFIPESESEVEGKRIVNENTPGIFIQSEGAIVFEGSKYGLFDNVFVNSAGYATYLGKDMGLFFLKFKKFKFDHSVTITDVEQKQHFQLAAKAGGLINKEWEEKSSFIQHGRLALTSGKISSRDGGVPLASDLVEEVKKNVLTKSKDKGITNKDEMAEAVTLGALKYAILKSAAGKNITFDFEKDLAFEGASGPYLQYAHVRAQSALKQAEDLWGGKTSPEIREGEVPVLERMLERFPAYVEKALNDYSPHHIAGYLQDLAQEFNSFYANTKIADEQNPDFAHNVALVKAFAQTMKNGLWLLGIETVEQM